MSNPGDNGGPPEGLAFDALERAVTQALEHIEAMESRLVEAESKNSELGEVVKRFTKDPGEADRILSRLGKLEEENEDLKRRLTEGREGVDRLLAKIRFLENHE